MQHASSSNVIGAAPAGSQTLLRGLDVIDAVREQPLSLAQLSARLGLNRSTVHRLASALVERGYLRLLPRGGYELGPKLLELGHAAHEQLDLTRIARRHLETLAEQTGDTVHLGVIDGGQALHLEKVPRRRRVEIGSGVGERDPLLTTALGKALLLDEARDVAREHFVARGGGDLRRFAAWWKAMRRYAELGFTFDFEENDDRIRCVAAPVRDDAQRIVAAISVSRAAQHTDGERMNGLGEAVAAAAQAVSRELGWRS